MTREDHREIALVLRMHAEVLEERVVASPFIVASELASSVAEYCRAQSLGYYPALEYFEKLDVLDADLIDAFHGILWFVTDMTGRELPHLLRKLAVDVRIGAIHPLALSIPAARPSHVNSLHELERHLTPDQVRVSVQLHGLADDMPLDEKGLRQHVAGVVKPLFDLVSLQDITTH